MGHWRKGLRYLRWASKAVFLLLFTVPIAYVPPGEWPVAYGPVVSLTSPFARPVFSLPITQSPCNVWLTGYCNIGAGEWLACPLGAAQSLLTGKIEAFRLIPLIVAVLIVIVLVVLLGNFLCSWVCPVGTIVDSFDKGIEKFLPKVEARRSKKPVRSMQNTQGGLGSRLLCPLCPLGRVASKRSGVLANGILASALVGSFALKFNVFCTVCPIGVLTRGLMHLKATTYILGTQIIYPIIVELWVFPLAAVLASLKGKRFFCKRLCPLAPILNGVGALNPFIKPKVKQEKCVMKGCPDECEDYRLDYCGFCRLQDDRKCEKVCPVDINLVDHGSLSSCTKCLECYIVCDYDAISIDRLSKPEISHSARSFYNRLRKAFS